MRWSAPADGSAKVWVAGPVASNLKQYYWHQNTSISLIDASLLTSPFADVKRTIYAIIRYCDSVPSVRQIRFCF